jgi:DNA-binding beta-propeller fold protein YncE
MGGKKMKRALTVFAFALAFVIQGRSEEPLRLVKTIDVPGVEGKFDHFAVDLKAQRLFLAAPVHKTVEVFDLVTGTRIHSISGLVTPHAVLHIPTSNKLLISDGGNDTPNGWCRILRGDTFETIQSVRLSVDADSIRYDPDSKYLYMTNGGDDAHNNYSLISIINTSDDKHVGDIRVESPSLEAMAIEQSGRRLFVNMEANHQIGVIDLDKRQVVSTWPIPDAEGNAPMKLDEAQHRLFIGVHKPARFVVFDTDTGKVVLTVPCVGGADDLFYDPVRQNIYISGDEGFVSVIRQRNADSYEAIAKIPTGPGARNSLFVPELNQLFVAVPGKGEQKAKVLVFQVEP